MNLYKEILQAKISGRRLLAILLDPDKVDWPLLDLICAKIMASPATHIFIGGSYVESTRIDELVAAVKARCTVPVVLFPGHPSQLSRQADGVLLLSLLSGRNPDFLIGHQVTAAPLLQDMQIEVISTAYLLLESGTKTAVELVSKTKPLALTAVDEIVHTALAAKYLGHQLVYLEAGSGAKNPVPGTIITSVAKNINLPLLVGGGIDNKESIEQAYQAGADLVVIGTAFENDFCFFDHA